MAGVRNRRRVGDPATGARRRDVAVLVPRRARSHRGDGLVRDERNRAAAGGRQRRRLDRGRSRGLRGRPAGAADRLPHRRDRRRTREGATCVEDFGYDAAVDYRSPTFEADLAAACPDGVDVYFDNTTGAISDAVLRLINPRARIVVCGTASVVSWDPWPVGPLVSRHLLMKRASMEGFLFFDHEHRLGEAVARLTPLVRDGRLRHREDVLEGIDSAPDSIAGLYRGDNLGKRVIRV
ncbi:zinc-binding dehydrogenase [Micromonospora kangleipakensis]|uniref:zinc-binding dehydrogenase n=1 Tax=Micromonospora kangleipakensis TaxID=1077942 RepID=UPI001F5F15D4|nr:zinc-binding dehydrogenase [Micromonospora kangleipakensis]